MRQLLAVFLIAVWTFQAPAGQADEAADIQGVISDQIAAFQADDFDTAFTFASPMIKSLFGTSSRFGQMVQQGYPMVWRPADVRFIELERRGGRLVQGVMITDQTGALHVLDYEMVPQAEGWRINGVRFRPAAGAGA